MAASDPIADMLTKVRNAAQARHESVDIPTSKLKLEIVKILKTEGYIKNFKKAQDEGGHSIIRISLKYDEKNESVIHGLERISTPGRRSSTARSRPVSEATLTLQGFAVFIQL